MLNQSFDDKTLLKLTTKKEIIDYKLGRNVSEYITSLSTIASKITNKTFTFHTLNTFTYNHKTVYRVSSPEEYYALRKISDNIKRLYRIKYSHKEDIISQVANILSDTSSYNLIRLDVKDFFETINFEYLIKKLESDNILSHLSLKILKSLNLSIAPTTQGLPRGLSISSVLSEIYMEEIDAHIRSQAGVYFYARYVDDIIIVTHDEKIDMNCLINIFSEKDLSLNSKSNTYKIASVDAIDKTIKFNFLGYDYCIHRINNDDKLRKLTIDMSEKKIKKIKTRIIHAILSYYKDCDENLLIKRIQFLTGNYTVKIDTNYKKEYSEEDTHALKGGIYYNNKFINTYDNLSVLNDYLKKLLFCKKANSIGKAVQKIPLSTRRKLIAHCFIKGHSQAIFHRFSQNDIQKIKQCWS
ncbi:RNA-directed DNA polymerase (Reverse transcriptase) [Enterobacter soli]|uniref:antiviral reverse transcriptase Drt3a n=1 Tax=Enterobacter soli TaxID=885040 RepID=UPI000223C546|nr:antiviral reverse transcriptase Drt3a [Enterobacter soli]AEN62841.1 RNA-directed DNA polymerase (Reverse transcriptase) [Enterobacter soli]OAT41765.1 RNA-directed DNA polymerase [Enterobacter soli ATCC BAA-2102]